MVISWILHSVSNDIAESIMYLDGAFDMWSVLYDRFHQGNNLRVFQIKQFLSNLFHGSSDVSGYFTRLRTLWKELKDFRHFSYLYLWSHEAVNRSSTTGLCFTISYGL